jgi:hypothetical protein
MAYANDDYRRVSINVRLTPEQATSILSRLGRDRKFYEAFRKNPNTALQTAGFSVPKSIRLPENLAMPSQAAIKRFRRTGSPNPPPYNGGCLAWATIYAIASQTSGDS